MDRDVGEVKYIIAIDPGTEKCGLAVADMDGQIVLQEIVPAVELIGTVGDVARQFSPALLVLGDRTGAKKLRGLFHSHGIEDLVIAVKLVDEHLTSQEARMRYLRDRQRQGKIIHRLIPLGLQVPDQAYDDYVAVILAQRYLKQLGHSV